MKKFLFLCILVSLFLISCKGNGSEPGLSSAELNRLLSEYATYLSNNYDRGDTLFFETENGETEILRIETSYTTSAIVIPDDDDGEDDDDDDNDMYVQSQYLPKVPSERIDCYGTGIYLTTWMASTSSIMIYIGILNTGALEPKIDISCGRASSTSSTTNTPAIPQPNTNQLLLQDKSGWCLLERNVGIVQMADTSGHAWTLKQ